MATRPSENAVLTAALAYADKGWPVFPCRAADKRPHTEHGLHDASTDSATIRRWWMKWPDAMVACPTGPAVGGWVLDVDDVPTFTAAAEAIELPIPATAKAVTGKGEHIWFAWDDAAPIRNAQRDAKGWPFPDLPGAEVRGEGGYVILPPSRHPSGRFYTWQRDEDPSEAPDELLTIIGRGRAGASRAAPSSSPTEPLFKGVIGRDTPYGLAGLAAECEAIRMAGEGAQEGTLNSAALKVGGLVAGGQLLISTARGQLFPAAFAMPSHNPANPWTPETITAKIERGLRDGAATPRRPVDPGNGRPADAETVRDSTPSNDPGLAAEPNAEPDLLPLIDAGDLADKPIEPREFMTDGLEPRGSVTYLTGIGASGKSLLTQQRMTCSAAGLPFLGVQCRPGVSIYITCEDSKEEMHRRQDSINKALGISWTQLHGRLFLVSLKGMLNKEFCTFDAENRMRTTPRWASTVATIRKVGATHVALDNVAHLFTGNENIRNQVAAFTGLIDRLAQEINGGVLLLGHPNKAGSEFSGSTAWENQVRARLYLALDSREDGTSDPDVRVLTNSKPNYSRRGEAISFRWHQWAFRLEDDLPKGMGVELAANAAANADNDLFLTCLAERTKQHRAVSENRSPVFAPTVFAKMPESKRIGKARLEAAMDRLFRIGRIERAELWRGADRKPVFGLRVSAGNGAVNTMQGTRATGSEMADCFAGDAPNTHTVPKGMSGAAQEAAAPYQSSGRYRGGSSEPVF